MEPSDLEIYRWLLRDKYQTNETQLTPALAADMARIKNGEPIQYVIGWVPFLGCHIDLSKKTLIPRPETEFWVEQVIKSLPVDTNKSILDLCCGSGCIGIAFLKHLPLLKVDFVDLSPTAVEQTNLNLQINHLDGREVQIFQSDLFASIPFRSYHLIVCNPPYVDRTGEYDPEIAYEPEQALFAQKNGFGLIERVIFESKKYLLPAGELIIEFGLGQEKMIAEIIKKAAWSEFQFYPDQFGVTRYVCLKKTVDQI